MFFTNDFLLFMHHKFIDMISKEKENKVLYVLCIQHLSVSYVVGYTLHHYQKGWHRMRQVVYRAY